MRTCISKDCWTTHTHTHTHIKYMYASSLAQLKETQQKRQTMSDQVMQSAVINCNKEPAFEEKKTKLRLKILEMIDLSNDHNKRFEELSE